MNRPPAQSPWSRLTAAARLAPPPPVADAPPGFATRVVARAFERAPASLASLCDVFSWRALAAAALIAIASVAVNLGAVLGDGENDSLAVSDPVAEVLSLT